MHVSRTSWFLVTAVLAVGFAFMLQHATRGHDWPGWDEGWAVVAFPLGIPAAVAAGIAASRRVSAALVVAAVTGAVWAWGAALFLAWIAVG